MHLRDGIHKTRGLVKASHRGTIHVALELETLAGSIIDHCPSHLAIARHTP